MKLVRLHIEGFGRLADITLDFGDGLTVIAGPNEAGKSTVRECLLRTLFGFPEAHFNEARAQYEPRYSGARYAATLAYRLDDGRAFEITRDFSRPDVPTRTVEADTQRPVPALTGDRRASPGEAAFGISLSAYRAAAVVTAADLMASNDDDAVAALTERLASIIGSAGDESAAEAVERLKAFGRSLGERSPNTPLGKAILEADEADERLRRFRADHAGLESTLAQLADLERERRDLVERRTRCDAALAIARMRSYRARISAAQAASAVVVSLEGRRETVSTLVAPPPDAKMRRIIDGAIESLRVAERARESAVARASGSSDDRDALQVRLDADNAALVERRAALSGLKQTAQRREAEAAARAPIPPGVLEQLEREADDVDAAESRERALATKAAIARQSYQPSPGAGAIAIIVGLLCGIAGAVTRAAWAEIVGFVLFALGAVLIGAYIAAKGR
ncbi:MAG TPA: AAA family ATPase, partial [Candidatus Eremiobacteraceae bacterium]|nr:AAA family ATPase [Candidatus Eremiobacteraceae bacterium]